jgi:hypothetical protein
MRPIDANESAIVCTRCWSAGIVSATSSAVCRSPSANSSPRQAAWAARRPSAPTWFKYVFVAATRLLVAGAERQHLLGLLGKRRAGVVRERDGERAARAGPGDELDHVWSAT